MPPTWNPVADVSASTISDYEAVALTTADTFAILKKIDDRLVWTLVVVLASTALRASEVLGLDAGSDQAEAHPLFCGC